jgi:hypothetical protein
MNMKRGNRLGALRLIILFMGLLILISTPGLRAETDPPPLMSISAEKVADYVHAIVEADREIYTTYIVNRLQEQGIVLAREDWKGKNAIPLPAQFLHYSSKVVAESGSGIRFRLISLWPIYLRNGPATEFERKALEQLSINPEIPQRGIVATGKKKFFQAVYADKAISSSCISCHNAHPLSPKRNFKMGGVLAAWPPSGAQT